MSKKIFLTLALALAPLGFLACSDETSTTQDMAIAPDMSASGGQTCLQVVTCGAGCAGSATCQNACAAKGSTKAQMQFQALYACAYGQCTVAHDGGTAACSSATDTAAGCQTCVAAAAQSAACMTQLNACLSGT